jgi:acyl-CoA thioester hydrolase
MSAESSHLAGELRDGRHELVVRVYYEDTDFTGVVYHASYLRFMERGRTDYMRLLGVAQSTLFAETARETPGFHFVVRSLSIEFLRSAHMDDVLTVVTQPEEVKGASVTLRQWIMRGPETLVEARVRVAFITDGKARRIPQALRTAMALPPCVPPM